MQNIERRNLKSNEMDESFSSEEDSLKKDDELKIQEIVPDKIDIVSKKADELKTQESVPDKIDIISIKADELITQESVPDKIDIISKKADHLKLLANVIKEVNGKLKIKEEDVKEDNVAKTKRVFETYSFKNNPKTQTMPIDAHREEILNFLSTTSTVIIHGPTGCGKTTRVPQFIMDDCQRRKVFCNIVVAQPRRIAAISVARRVCEERGWDLGTVCGYQVGLDKAVKNDTILSFVTTGVLLQKLTLTKHLNEYSHIIIDEVHERTQDLDFLLLIVRRYLYTNSLDVKVILMSATFQTDKFADYFRRHGMGNKLLAPTIFVTKKSQFQTSFYYLEDLQSLMDFMPDFSIFEPKVMPELYKLLVKLLIASDARSRNDETIKGGNVLVFLPGFFQIDEAHKFLTESMNADSEEGCKRNWLILPLHSSITNLEQRRVFLPPPQGFRKIILSTNIAESSITVVDIEYVIDFCLTKNMTVHPVTKYESLRMEWASQVNCMQRSGRVGRVSNGYVYRFVPQKFYEAYLTNDIQPEMLRASISRTVLGTKLLDLAEPPKEILSSAIDPPDLANIDAAILTLKESGALLKTCRNLYIKSDGDITFLGRIMSNLPIEMRLAKMICLGYMFSCMEECIVIASACSLGNIFTTPFQEKLKSYINKLNWADGTCSDLLLYLNIYKAWERNKKAGAYTNLDSEMEWCRTNYVSHRALKDWSTLVREIKKRLEGLHIVERVGPEHVSLGHLELPLVLQVVICGAFYPNYFIKSGNNNEDVEPDAVKMLDGLNPMQTVYFTNMDPSLPGPIYAKHIKNLLKPCSDNMEVYFSHSNKVFVKFTDTRSSEFEGEKFTTTMPGNISIDVYKALRMKHARLPMVIPVCDTTKSWEYADKIGVSLNGKLVKEPKEKTMLPDLLQITISVQISYIIDAGHFFVQLCNLDVSENMDILHKLLNSKPLKPVNGKPSLNGIYAAKFPERNTYCRCRVIAIRPFLKKEMLSQVLFIDYGTAALVKPEYLYNVPNEALMIAPLAIECVLSEIQPTIVLNPKGIWTKKATKAFSQNTDGVELIAKIFSVVNGVVAVELYKSGSDLSLNKWLIQQGHGQYAEENFLSKENHLKRLEAQKYSSYTSSAEVDEDILITFKEDIVPPPIHECTQTINLRGPFTPLELKLLSVTKNTQKIFTDPASVNSILLDSHPQDKHDRLLVAGDIKENEAGTALTLRQTTLMPNIQGFPSLMSLLFCPKMVPKPTEDGTCFGAILCGLGENENTGASLYPTHDITLTLDTVLDKDDFININELRFWLNNTLMVMENNYYAKPAPMPIEKCQREIKRAIFSLLNKQRLPQVPQYIIDAENWRRFLYKGDILEPGNTFVENEIWKLHWTMILREEDKQFVTMQKHLEDLKDMAKNVKTMVPISCKLCDTAIETITQMRLHLSSKQHKMKAITYLNKH